MKDGQFVEIMEHIVQALEDRGYDSYAQLYGYVTTGDPTYITIHKDARKAIQTLDFDCVKQYVEDMR